MECDRECRSEWTSKGKQKRKEYGRRTDPPQEDPQSAVIVLELTEKAVSDKKLTCLMVTHNMQTALDLGNRLIMMHEGKIVLDLNKEEKEKLTVEDLIAMFRSSTKEDLQNDRMLLL